MWLLLAQQYYLANSVFLADAAIIDEIKSLHSSVHELLESSKNIDDPQLDQPERRTTTVVNDDSEKLQRAVIFTFFFSLFFLLASRY